MSSSKVILVGAISVVFGLYSLSLYRVNGYIGNTAEVATYINRASDNAKAGVQRALNLWSRGVDSNDPNWSTFANSASSETFNLLDPVPAVDKFTYTVTWSVGGVSNYHFSYNDHSVCQLTVVSKGYYRAPNEPSNFQGHEVDRTVIAQFTNTNKGSDNYPWYVITMTSVYSTINYTAEHQLDSLQSYKPNLIGY